MATGVEEVYGITELVLVFVFSLLGLIAAVRLRLPPVLGILLAGALVGPNALGWVQNSETINSFSEIGAILLLFVIGIEFSLNKIIKFGVRAILVAFAKITFVFVIVYETALLLGLSSLESLIIGNIFAITSTTLFSKLIKGTPEENKEEVNLMFAVLILEDIFAVFILTLVSSLGSENALIINNMLFSIIKSLLVLAVAYIFLQKAVRAFFDYILRFKTEEMLVFASLSVCAILSYLSSVVSLDASIGAFLAGSMMASLREFKKIEKTILPFGLFFSSFFFLSIGMVVNFNSLGENWIIILVLVTISSLAKFFSIAGSTYFFGYTSRAAVFSGLTMLTVGEFSLLIAKKSQAFMSFDIIGTVSVSVFVTALASALVMGRGYEINDYLTSSIPSNIKTVGRHISRYLNAIVLEFEPTGKFFRTSMKEFHNIVIYGSALIIINGALILLESVLVENNIVTFEGFWFFARIFLHLAISFSLIVRFIRSCDVIISAFMETFRKLDKKDVPLERKVVHNSIIIVLLLACAQLLPFIFQIFNLPNAVNGILFVFVILAFLFIWDTMKIVNVLFSRLSKRRTPAFLKIPWDKKKSSAKHLAMFLNV